MPDPKLPLTKKTFDPQDANPCSGCSNCCEYLAMEIDRPTSLDDFDAILWYVIHKDVWVYLDDDNVWHVQFNTPCEKLSHRRCGFYAHRPEVCREYEPADCVRYGDGPAEKHLFKNEIDLFRYLAKKRPKLFVRMKKKLSLPDDILDESHSSKRQTVIK